MQAISRTATPVSKFQKISFEQFLKDFQSVNPLTSVDEVHEIYDRIVLPTRATKGSAGYDIRTTMPIELHPGHKVMIPTGLRCEIDEGWFMGVYPRSGIGFKYGAMLANTVGIVDSDYAHADNEGHIWVCLKYPTMPPNLTWPKLELAEGDRICQGIFMPYGITVDDSIEAVRYGGMGSTGK